MTERIVVSLLAFLCAATLVFIALGSPLWLNLIHYRAPASAVYQAKGQDLINLILIAPICIAGGVLAAAGSAGAARVLMFPAIYLMYASLAYGVGMEWSDPRYTGNSERFAFLFYSLNRLNGVKTPRRGREGKVVYSTVFVVYAGLALIVYVGFFYIFNRIRTLAAFPTRR